MSILELRKVYHRRICQEIIRITRRTKRKKPQGKVEEFEVEYPNFADVGNEASMQIAWGIVKRMGCLGGGLKSVGKRPVVALRVLRKIFLNNHLIFYNIFAPVSGSIQRNFQFLNSTNMNILQTWKRSWRTTAN